jgi:hypothetical protein
MREIAKEKKMKVAISRHGVDDRKPLSRFVYLAILRTVVGHDETSLSVCLHHHQPSKQDRRQL